MAITNAINLPLLVQLRINKSLPGRLPTLNVIDLTMGCDDREIELALLSKRSSRAIFTSTINQKHPVRFL